MVCSQVVPLRGAPTTKTMSRSARAIGGALLVEDPAIGDVNWRPGCSSSDGGQSDAVHACDDCEAVHQAPVEELRDAVAAPHAAPNLIGAWPEGQRLEPAVDDTAAIHDRGCAAVDQHRRADEPAGSPVADHDVELRL